MKLHDSRKQILAILIAVAAAAVLYRSFTTGTGADYSMQEFLATRTETAEGPAAAEPRLGSVAEMLAGLERRLRAEGGDAGEWLLLAKSYYHLDRQPEAREAWDRAVALGYRGDWAPLPSIDSVAKSSVEIDPAHYLAATTGSKPDSIHGAPSPGIRLQVSLAPELAETLAPDTAVYLFAREIEAGGPPLAVVRKQVGDLPLTISLGDRHAMMPGRSISSVDRLIVGARISISGSASRRPGDFERLSQPLSARSDQVVDLHIDSRG